MEKQEKKTKRIQRKMDQIIGDEYSMQDPLGSYTGKPTDPETVPVQDADDL